MKLSILSFTATAAVALMATAAQAGPGFIIAPIAATVDVNGPGFGSITNTFDESGLSSLYTPGVTNFDAYIATNPLHTTTFSGFEFFGNAGTSTLQVTYDLGSVKSINALALWNEESSGIGSLTLLSSLDGITFSLFAAGLTPFDNPLAPYPAEVFGFGNLSTRYVRFEASGCPQPNPGNFASCAIGEVAFRTGSATVPEPQSWALMIAGFGLVGAAMRRRASVVA